MRALQVAVVSMLICGALCAKEKKPQSPPPFFLQDPSDSMCLAGEEFKRCSIDTLFYVVGSPGTFLFYLFFI